MDKKSLKIINELLAREVNFGYTRLENANTINLVIEEKYEKAIKENVCLIEKIEDYKKQLATRDNFLEEIKKLNITLKNEVEFLYKEINQYKTEYCDVKDSSNMPFNNLIVNKLKNDLEQEKKD